MSLDISLCIKSSTGAEVEVFEWNITHNLNRMAEAAGIYQAMWRPEEIGANVAADIVPILEDGLAKLVTNAREYEQYNPENGWGNYEGLVTCATAYLKACKDWPEAEIHVSR